MPAIISDAIEESTIVITAAFTDEDGAAVTPKTVIWSLHDSGGNVINSREDVEASPNSSVNIVLSGNDLAITSELDLERIITIEATYDSSLGLDLPIKDEARFSIVNLRYVT